MITTAANRCCRMQVIFYDLIIRFGARSTNSVVLQLADSICTTHWMRNLSRQWDMVWVPVHTLYWKCFNCTVWLVLWWLIYIPYHRLDQLISERVHKIGTWDVTETHCIVCEKKGLTTLLFNARVNTRLIKSHFNSI